jgi:hypothetical protein
MSWTRIVGLLFVASTASAQEVRAQVDTFLSWLPADTETILASGRKFKVPDKANSEEPSEASTVALAYLLRSLGDAFGAEPPGWFGVFVAMALMGSYFAV